MSGFPETREGRYGGVQSREREANKLSRHTIVKDVLELEICIKRDTYIDESATGNFVLTGENDRIDVCKCCRREGESEEREKEFHEEKRMSVGVWVEGKWERSKSCWFTEGVL